MTQTNFNILLSQAEKELEQIKKESKQNRPFFRKLSPKEYRALFVIEAEKVLLKRNSHVTFQIDDTNRDCINQLYYYLAGDKRFKGDPYKGILILGNLGSGKTVIMSAFCNLWNKLGSKIIHCITAKELWPNIKSTPEGINFYKKRPLYIDDIGKEPQKVIDFGTEVCPMADLLSLRYDTGAITFSSGNYTLETLTNHYGETITDRMKDIFNVVILPGKSRRGVRYKE